jgi:Uncharacterised nucleotidyltransferase
MTMDTSCRNLLRAVVRDSTDPEQIRALSGRVTAWDALIDLALQHRVLQMLFARLAEMAPAVPTSALQRIQQENDRIVVHNIANAAELIAVLQRFDREGIPAMPFKGVMLAASAYGDMLNRPGGDLDLLIHARDLVRASDLLRERGFELEVQPIDEDAFGVHHIYEHKFIRPSDEMVLELRWRLEMFGNRFRRNLVLDWVWNQRRTVTLAGANVPNIRPEILLLLLCMHGNNHFWSRLVWVCDVAKLLASAPELNWEEVLAEARRQGLKRPLMLGILLAERIMGAAVPPEILRACEADTTVRKLADHFANNLLENPGIGPPGRVPYGFQLLDLRDRLKFLLSLDFWRASDRDRKVLGLPKWLRPLYYLLRPLRLLWDRSAR